MAKIKICLDAGHYGKYNRSPAVSEYYESDMTWKLHKLLKAALEVYGIEVIVTREKKKEDLPLYERGRASKGCDLFISLHSNAVGKGVDNETDRVDVYAPLSGKRHDIARKLANTVARVMETKQPGYVKTRAGSSGQDYYGVIRGATSVGVPGLLIEHSFHTNTTSALWLLDDDNLEILAKEEAAVIAEHYGLLAKEDTEVKHLGDRTLVKGMSGNDVKELKIALAELDYDVFTEEFDEITETALNKFKADNGLEPNGKAGGGVVRVLQEKKVV